MNELKCPPSAVGSDWRRFRWQRATFAAVAILSLSKSACARDPSRALTQSIHRIWQTQQGLPQGTIYSVYQTKDRYLWLGTKTGLVRFDGVQFTVVRELGGTSVENIWIRQLYQDDLGALWIATDADGLIR